MNWLDEIAGAGCSCDKLRGAGALGAAHLQQQPQQRGRFGGNRRAEIIAAKLAKVNAQIAALNKDGDVVDPRLAHNLFRLQERLQRRMGRTAQPPARRVVKRPARPERKLPGGPAQTQTPIGPVSSEPASSVADDFESGDDYATGDGADLDAAADYLFDAGNKAPSTDAAQAAQQGTTSPTPATSGSITDPSASVSGVDPEYAAALASFGEEDETPARARTEDETATELIEANEMGEAGGGIDLDTFLEVAAGAEGIDDFSAIVSDDDSEEPEDVEGAGIDPEQQRQLAPRESLLALVAAVNDVDQRGSVDAMQQITALAVALRAKFDAAKSIAEVQNLVSALESLLANAAVVREAQAHNFKILQGVVEDAQAATKEALDAKDYDTAERAKSVAAQALKALDDYNDYYRQMVDALEKCVLAAKAAVGEAAAQAQTENAQKALNAADRAIDEAGKNSGFMGEFGKALGGFAGAGALLLLALGGLFLFANK